jgi:hypothetical protein
MSYFGNDGPSQDGDFISGINRGSHRLHAARSKRLRHANLNGFGSVEKKKQLGNAFTDMVTEDWPSKEKTSRRANSYVTAYNDLQAAEVAYTKASKKVGPIIKEIVELRGGVYFVNKNDPTDILPLFGPRSAFMSDIPASPATITAILKAKAGDTYDKIFKETETGPQEFVMTKELFDEIKNGKYLTVKVTRGRSSLGVAASQVTIKKREITAKEDQIDIIQNLIAEGNTAGASAVELAPARASLAARVAEESALNNELIAIQKKQTGYNILLMQKEQDLIIERAAISPAVTAYDNADVKVEALREELGENFADGPYMRETRVWGLGAVVAVGVGVWALKRWKYNRRVSSNKSAMYAVYK